MFTCDDKATKEPSVNPLASANTIFQAKSTKLKQLLKDALLIQLSSEAIYHDIQQHKPEFDLPICANHTIMSYHIYRKTMLVSSEKLMAVLHELIDSYAHSKGSLFDKVDQCFAIGTHLTKESFEQSIEVCLAQNRNHMIDSLLSWQTAYDNLKP